MLFDLLDNIIPLVIVFMLLRGILSTLFGKKKRGQEEFPEEYPENNTDYEFEDEVESAKREPTPADIFEQKMRDKEKANGTQKQTGIVHDSERIIRDSAVEKDGSAVRYDDNVLLDANVEKDGSTVRYGNRVLRDSSIKKDGSIVCDDKAVSKDYKPVHVENCQLQHERGKVYREEELQKWSLTEECTSLEVKKESEQKLRSPKRFKNSELVRGIVIGEVLGKPRALKPYGEE